jgi:membrane protein YdbS with pleckstrin-like domain
MNQSNPRVFRALPATRAARVWFGVLLAVLGLPLVWLLFTLLQAPEISYRIDSKELTISSTVGSSHQEKVIRLARIQDAHLEWLRGGALRFGTQKPGYCVGFFAYPRIGEVWEVADCSELAVVISAGGETTPVAVTPADRDAFLAALRSQSPGTFAPAGRRGQSWWLTLVSVLLVLAGVVLVLVTVFFVAPARLRYAVGEGGLEVRTLASRRRFPLAGARVRKHRPLQGARLSGMPLPGYQVGSWLFDSMATTVLASVREEGVLVEGEGRVFVSPQDADAFIAAAVERGATAAESVLQRRR